MEDMQPVITGKNTYIAPFVNAEKPQYLVIEDSFPNGRPALERGFGVYMTDRKTVNLSERMTAYDEGLPVVPAPALSERPYIST